MRTRFGQLSVRYSARGIPTYFLELWHDGLKKHRVIRGDSSSIIESKANLQAEEWNQRWAVVNAREQDRSKKALEKRQQAEQKILASERTADAQQALDELSSILKATLSVNDAIDWETLKDKTPFPERKPVFQSLPPKPTLPPIPDKPSFLESKYIPSFGLLDRLFSSRKDRLISEKQALFQSDLKAWQESVGNIQRTHDDAVVVHEKSVESMRQQHEKQRVEWSARRDAYIGKKADEHAAIDTKRLAYESNDQEAIVEYCDLVLSSSIYPDCFPQEFDLDYDQAAKTLIVDYKLPAPDDLPRLKGVKYIASRDEFEEQYINDAQLSKLYDNVLYQVALRTVHELFEADVISAIDAVVFNGIVTAVDRTTGKPTTSCVLSLRANHSEFLEINLAQVDPKACFKALKGVGSSKLHGLSPVPPIMPLRREDGRFVSAYEVASTLDGSVNLASMDWEDFEHLVREVFEREFSSSGGEVKVTKASRDGGVDAIAFDPDPIRGGKIVIQAKRYTNTVGVGAVRDLYGTVLNEGATKGILVTTSDYGPDSYAFANGKPLVLLSGANLLHMLEKHGHRARIDLQEAKASAV
ncbi:restriction endonuclease [Desulfobulbus sp.]|uniref:restriction endonuclease n=1 Tax=Desulfobulbus sp. TaxID=895 RepID=UPI00286F993C|nr:restriction endonuclease [Desulfobulbus sp.]